MKFLSLFAGIGGFDLGLERAGMQCVGQVEIDEWRQRVLAQHWPDVKRIGDIRDVDRTTFESVDLICGGYPCQGESGSGLRRGTADDRWLWPEMLRVVAEYRPTWAIGENVINHENMGLANVLFDLGSIGYKVRSFVIPSAACGLPTVERHIWTIATTDEKRLQRYCGTPTPWQPMVSSEFSRSYQVLPDRWALSESRVCRVGERPADWVDRIKAIGDAVPPQVVEIIGRAILAIEGTFDHERA